MLLSKEKKSSNVQSSLNCVDWLLLQPQQFKPREGNQPVKRMKAIHPKKEDESNRFEREIIKAVSLERKRYHIKLGHVAEIAGHIFVLVTWALYDQEMYSYTS